MSTTPKRKQSPDEARETCRILKDTYERLGYRTITGPFLPPGETGPNG